MSNATVQFGRFDADVTVDFKLHLKISQEGQLVFEDDFDTIMGADLIVDNDTVYFKILDLKLAPLPSTKRSATLDRMGLSSQEYVALRDALHFSLGDLRQSLNANYFDQGIVLPYNVDEIYTSVYFREHAMYVMLEIEEDVDRWFEDMFWDQRAIEERTYNSFGDVNRRQIYQGCADHPDYEDRDGDTCSYYLHNSYRCGFYDDYDTEITAFDGCCVCQYVRSEEAFSWYAGGCTDDMSYRDDDNDSCFYYNFYPDACGNYEAEGALQTSTNSCCACQQ